MPSEYIQRQIDRLLQQAVEAIPRLDWQTVRARAQALLILDPGNEDAKALLEAAERGIGNEAAGSSAAAVGHPLQADGPGEGAASSASETRDSIPDTRPRTFVNGRYEVIRFLGEGGKKQVYLAHDTTLERDVAFALIKIEGLDDAGRQRILREGQAMGTLGSHPHIVAVFDLGDEQGRPYMVTELMRGGDVEGVVEDAPEHRLPLERALQIADEVCQGLEFAHSRGIVHRDLKPGNVWLTEDGVAKIGDFGLAVSLDRTRRTQAGMMVGTVSYMPPEQATGGAVTPQSDLYSLGALLYEMVAGRPPFLGDEIVAVIGQHLNTPPVSPAWHRHDYPPGLEALILRLLEKDPSRRPASATEVRAAIQSISGALGRDPSSPALLPHGEKRAEQLAPTADSLLPTASANPLYRRAFVGREAELRQLQVAFDAALSGRGSLAMVVGEPGIGKTAVVEQLDTYAALHGGKALVGHCYEEGSLSLAYLRFVEAMRSYVLAREPAGLKADLGSGAGEVARILSEIRDRVPESVGATHASPSDADEDRWRLLQAVTSFLRNASLVQPLLIILEDLLDHLARSLDGARLLIVGTYRDVEVDRSHPLSNALAELRRGQNFQRVPLRGLTAEEVQRMMAAVAQREIPWPFAELVHRQTEGNPLFVQEMLRYLVEEGLVAEREGALRRVGDDSLAGRIPEGLRDVIRKRLSRLSDPTNQALSIASVVGREFRLDVLQWVGNLSDKAVEAARHYENALKAQEVLDPDDAARRCDLLLALCEAMLSAEEPARVASGPAEQAFALAEGLSDNTRAARAAVLALLDGRLEETVSLADELLAAGAEVGIEPAADLWRIVADLYLGHVAQVSASTLISGPRGRTAWGYAAWILAQLGRHDEAQALRARFGDLGAESDETSSFILAHLLESAVLGGDEGFVRSVRPRVGGMNRFACAGNTLLSWPRILGGAAALLGEREQARALYEQAIESSAKIGNRPELALTHLQLAELLLGGESSEERATRTEATGNEQPGTGGEDRSEAMRHLDNAIAELRDMHMQPALERALRHKDVLKA